MAKMKRGECGARVFPAKRPYSGWVVATKTKTQRRPGFEMVPTREIAWERARAFEAKHCAKSLPPPPRRRPQQLKLL